MSKKLEAIIGVGAFLSAVTSSVAYGMSDAKGHPIPGREYVWPLLGITVFSFGAKPRSQKEKIDLPVGAVYTSITAGISAASYAVGYLLGL